MSIQRSLSELNPNWEEEIFENIVAKNFPKLMKATNPQIQEAQQAG